MRGAAISSLQCQALVRARHSCPTPVCRRSRVVTTQLLTRTTRGSDCFVGHLLLWQLHLKTKKKKKKKPKQSVFSDIRYNSGDPAAFQRDNHARAAVLRVGLLAALHGWVRGGPACTCEGRETPDAAGLQDANLRCQSPRKNRKDRRLSAGRPSPLL